MEELLAKLNRQIHRSTQTRFKLSDLKYETAYEMLYKCYLAEVYKRGVTPVEDQRTQEKVAKVAKWLTGDHKPGLLMYGSQCGTGKTTMARAISNLIGLLFDSCVSSERKVVYRVTAIDLAKMYSESPERYKSMVNQELLFIDDIGTEPSNLKIYGNEFSPITELLYNRYDRLKWTIATSNLDDNQIKERYGERIDDRLREMFDKIHFQGKSYRK